MAKVMTKSYQGSKFGVVSRKTMNEILAARAELAQRRADAEAAKAEAAKAASKKTRGKRAAPEAGQSDEAPQEVSDALE